MIRTASVCTPTSLRLLCALVALVLRMVLAIPQPRRGREQRQHREVHEQQRGPVQLAQVLQQRPAGQSWGDARSPGRCTWSA